MVKPLPPDPRELERIEIVEKLIPILLNPVAQLQLGPVGLGENNEVMVTVISPTYKYMTVNERYNAAWNLLQKAWPEFIKKYFVSLTLLTPEEWATIMQHERMIRQGEPHDPVG